MSGNMPALRAARARDPGPDSGTAAYAVRIGLLTRVLLPGLTAMAPTREDGNNRDG
jgi:hypothetical protein